MAHRSGAQGSSSLGNCREPSAVGPAGPHNTLPPLSLALLPPPKGRGRSYLPPLCSTPSGGCTPQFTLLPSSIPLSLSRGGSPPHTHT